MVTHYDSRRGEIRVRIMSYEKFGGGIKIEAYYTFVFNAIKYRTLII